jgi:hypothetical protein
VQFFLGMLSKLKVGHHLFAATDLRLESLIFVSQAKGFPEGRERKLFLHRFHNPGAIPAKLAAGGLVARNQAEIMQRLKKKHRRDMKFQATGVLVVDSDDDEAPDEQVSTHKLKSLLQWIFSWLGRHAYSTLELLGQVMLMEGAAFEPVGAEEFTFRGTVRRRAARDAESRPKDFTFGAVSSLMAVKLATDIDTLLKDVVERRKSLPEAEGVGPGCLQQLTCVFGKLFFVFQMARKVNQRRATEAYILRMSEGVDQHGRLIPPTKSWATICVRVQSNIGGRVVRISKLSVLLSGHLRHTGDGR